MKTNLKSVPRILAITLAVIAACFPALSQAGIEAEEKQTVTVAINFYNAIDDRTVPPYMCIIFHKIPKENVDVMDPWRAEIDKKLHESGGVIEDDDYNKITKVITLYVEKFISTGAVAVAIEFPRKKRGIMLFNKNKIPPGSKPAPQSPPKTDKPSIPL